MGRSTSMIGRDNGGHFGAKVRSLPSLVSAQLYSRYLMVVGLFLLLSASPVNMESLDSCLTIPGSLHDTTLSWFFCASLCPGCFMLFVLYVSWLVRILCSNIVTYVYSLEERFNWHSLR